MTWDSLLCTTPLSTLISIEKRYYMCAVMFILNLKKVNLLNYLNYAYLLTYLHVPKIFPINDNWQYFESPDLTMKSEQIVTIIFNTPCEKIAWMSKTHRIWKESKSLSPPLKVRLLFFQFWHRMLHNVSVTVELQNAIFL